MTNNIIVIIIFSTLQNNNLKLKTKMTNLEIEELTRDTLKSLNFKNSQSYIYQKDCLHMYYRWREFTREEDHHIGYRSFIIDVYDIWRVIKENKKQLK